MVSNGIPTRTIGAVLALAGFVIAILAGMAAGNEAATILLRALAALVVCNAVGLALGAAGERVIQEHISDYQKSNPVEDAERADSAGPAGGDDGILAV